MEFQFSIILRDKTVCEKGYLFWIPKVFNRLEYSSVPQHTTAAVEERTPRRLGCRLTREL